MSLFKYLYKQHCHILHDGTGSSLNVITDMLISWYQPHFMESDIIHISETTTLYGFNLG